MLWRHVRRPRAAVQRAVGGIPLLVSHRKSASANPHPPEMGAIGPAGADGREGGYTDPTCALYGRPAADVMRNCDLSRNRQRRCRRQAGRRSGRARRPAGCRSGRNGNVDRIVSAAIRSHDRNRKPASPLSTADRARRLMQARPRAFRDRRPGLPWPSTNQDTRSVCRSCADDFPTLPEISGAIRPGLSRSSDLLRCLARPSDDRLAGLGPVSMSTRDHPSDLASVEPPDVRREARLREHVRQMLLRLVRPAAKDRAV